MPAAKRFDLAVAYRVYPGISKTPFALSHDKLALTRACLKSFRRACGNLRVKTFALLDSCPDSYEALFREILPADGLEVIRFDRLGNRPSFLKQIELLSEQSDADLVYFAEDDYLYVPGALEECVKFLRARPDADFVTGYDHPDYDRLDLHRHSRETAEFEGRRWRTVNSTCLTFLTRRSTLQETASVLGSYSRGNPDCGTWLALTKRHLFNPIRQLTYLVREWDYFTFIASAWKFCPGQALLGRRYRLWVPQPTLATHMESTCLSPGVDWNQQVGSP